MSRARAVRPTHQAARQSLFGKLQVQQQESSANFYFLRTALSAVLKKQNLFCGGLGRVIKPPQRPDFSCFVCEKSSFRTRPNLRDTLG